MYGGRGCVRVCVLGGGGCACECVFMCVHTNREHAEEILIPFAYSDSV